MKGDREAATVFGGGRETRPAGGDVLAGARRKLAAGRLAAAERAPHLGRFEAEHVVQQKARALERREPLEDEHQGDRDVVRKIADRSLPPSRQ